MRRSELKNYIKQKAMEVEVKDFSKLIVERAKHLPEPAIEVIEKPRFTWRIKPLTTSFLALMTTILIVFILMDSTGVIPKETDPVFENMENVIALSSVQATSLIDVMESELVTTSTATLLRFGPMERDNKIKDELTDVARYLETIEKLYASNENFDVIDQPRQNQGFRRQMRFRTRDLTNRETDYEILYNQSYNEQTRAYTVTGEVHLGEKAYLMMVQGIKGEKGVWMNVSDGNSHHVILDYTETDGVHHYEIELVIDDVSIQKVEISLEQNETERTATLSFIEGDSIGTYVFTIVQEENMKIIQIRYSIDFDGELEEGDITIRILSLQQTTIYSIIVQPEGRQPFSITRGRFQSRNSSTPFSTII